MSKRPALEAFKKKAMDDEAFKAEYAELQIEFALIQKFIKARKNAHYSPMERVQRFKL